MSLTQQKKKLCREHGAKRPYFQKSKWLHCDAKCYNQFQIRPMLTTCQLILPNAMQPRKEAPFFVAGVPVSHIVHECTEIILRTGIWVTFFSQEILSRDFFCKLDRRTQTTLDPLVNLPPIIMRPIWKKSVHNIASTLQYKKCAETKALFLQNPNEQTSLLCGQYNHAHHTQRAEI